MTTIEWVRGSDGSEGMSWNALRAVRTVTRNRENNGKVRPTDVRVSANHCEHVNEACRFCYADRGNARLGGLPFKPGHRKDYTFEIDEKKLFEPLRRRKPTRIFVESMSDAFGEWWPDSFIDKLYAVMALCPQHTFINLSKRPERRRKYLSLTRTVEAIYSLACKQDERVASAWRWPLPNVIEGVSVSCQEEADAFVPILLDTTAAVRAVSAEPLLGPIKFRMKLGDDWLASGLSGERRGLDWVICGGESGPKARPMHPQWARAVRDQCKAAGVAFFFKQWGEHIPLEQSNGITSRGDVEIAGVPLKDGRIWRHEMPPNSHPAPTMVRVGKKAAGRLLDGVEHNEFPTMEDKPCR